MLNEKDIAIVGMACVFPMAENLRQYWSNLVNGVDAIGELPKRRWKDHPNFSLPRDHDAFIPCSRGGYLRDGFLFDPVPYGVLPNLVRYGDPDQFLMLHLVDHALRDAKIAEDDQVRERTDLIIGRGGYATGKLVELTLRAEMFETVIELIDRRFPEMLTGGRRREVEDYLRSTLTPKAADNVSTAVSNISASRAANRLNLRGAAYTVDGACASSLLAAEQATWRLRNHQCDVAVAAGLFLSKSPTFLYVFTQLGALSPQQMIRPFDRRADGLLAGEGGGAVVLKRLSDAYRDGDQIYAVIKGVGTASDGKGVDVLAPFGPGQVRALQRAYADAEVDPATIGFLEAHGTGTVVGDEVEVASIKEFFGTQDRPATGRAMGSVKSMIGHTMPAAGIASLIKVALSLSNKIMPPSLHCDQPREELSDAPFYIITQTRPWIHNSSLGPRRAGVNAFGFGGINGHVVMEEARAQSAKRTGRGFSTRPIEPGLCRASELFVLEADSRPGIVRQIQRLERFLQRDQSGATLADIAWTLCSGAGAKVSHRLAIIADNADHLRSLLARCLDRLNGEPHFDDIEEVYFSEHAESHEGKIAFVFPGMGFPGLIGNYPDHLMELCLHYPDVRAEFDFFEDRDRHPEDDIPTSAIFAPPANLPEEFRKRLKGRLAPPKVDGDPNQETAPRERYLAAMGVTLSNWIGWVLLSKFQIPVDMMTGQSQGEMAALCAAGVSNFHETAPSYWKTINIDARVTEGSRLAFAWATAEKIEPILKEYPGTHMAIYMAPEGVIFGGPRDNLMRIADRLRAEQILVQVLPYPPIHTPCLSHLKGELMETLSGDDFKVNMPNVDIYSSITTQKYPTDFEGVRDTLLLNVDRPLRVWQTVRQMHADGARIFVQVGGGHMAAHLEMLLLEGSKVVTAALDVDTRNPLTQLCHLCGILYAAGVPLKLDALFDHRTVRQVNLDAPDSPPPKPKMAVPLRIDWTPLYSPNVPPRESVKEETPAANAPSSTAKASGAEAVRTATPVSSPANESANVVQKKTPVGEGVRKAATVESPSDLPPATTTQAEPNSTEEVVEWSVDPELSKRLPILGNFGRIARFIPDEEIVVVRDLLLEEDHFLADHLFVHAESKPASHRLPVLPLTMSMEFVAEIASLLAPGLGLIGYENIRGRRWIGLRDSSFGQIRIEGRIASIDAETGVRRVECGIFFEEKLSFSATVLFADEYRRDLPMQVADARGEGPWPFTVEQVYGERLMFHGPSFHVVAGLFDKGNPAASAALYVRPKDELFTSNPEPMLFTDPCLMDGIGQIVGLWTMCYDQYILPTSADKVELYCPTPPVGTVTPIRIEVIEFNQDTKQIRANIEIEDGQGNVWVRVSNWSEWIMNWPKNYAECTRLPSRYLLARPFSLPGLPVDAVCSLVTKQDFTGVDLDWAARIFLHPNEMAGYFQAQGTKRRREIVLSRSAVKDAARVWWSAKHGGAYPHPADMCVGHDQEGKPFLEPADEPSLPRIGIAHTEGAALGVASAMPVGIDIEPLGSGAPKILGHFATDAEIALLEGMERQEPGQAWETRLWCAKEALSKLLETGLQGKPKSFEAIDTDPRGCFLMRHEESADRFIVQTTYLDGYIVGYATLPGAPSTESPCAAKWQLIPADQAS